MEESKYLPYIIYLPKTELKKFGKSYLVPINFKTLKNKRDLKVFLTKTQIKKLDVAKKKKEKVVLKFSKRQFKTTFDTIKKVNSLANDYDIVKGKKPAPIKKVTSVMYEYDPGTGKFVLPKKPYAPKIHESLLNKETKRCIAALEKKEAKNKKLEALLKTLKKQQEKCKKLEARLKAVRKQKQKDKEAEKKRKQAEKEAEKKRKQAEKLINQKEKEAKQNYENVEEIKVFNENMKLLEKVKNMEFLRDKRGVKLNPAQENFIKEARNKKMKYSNSAAVDLFSLSIPEHVKLFREYLANKKPTKTQRPQTRGPVPVIIDQEKTLTNTLSKLTAPPVKNDLLGSIDNETAKILTKEISKDPGNMINSINYFKNYKLK